MLHEIYRLIPF